MCVYVYVCMCVDSFLYAGLVHTFCCFGQMMFNRQFQFSKLISNCSMQILRIIEYGLPLLISFRMFVYTMYESTDFFMYFLLVRVYECMVVTL